VWRLDGWQSGKSLRIDHHDKPDQSEETKCNRRKPFDRVRECLFQDECVDNSDRQHEADDARNDEEAKQQYRPVGATIF